MTAGRPSPRLRISGGNGHLEIDPLHDAHEEAPEEVRLGDTVEVPMGSYVKPSDEAQAEAAAYLMHLWNAEIDDPKLQRNCNASQVSRQSLIR